MDLVVAGADRGGHGGGGFGFGDWGDAELCIATSDKGRQDGHAIFFDLQSTALIQLGAREPRCKLVVRSSATRLVKVWVPNGSHKSNFKRISWPAVSNCKIWYSISQTVSDHARPVVGGSQVRRGTRRASRLPVRPTVPLSAYRADLALSAGAVAFAQPHARERKPAHRAGWFSAEEAMHRGGVAPLPPQARLRAPVQQRSATLAPMKAA